MKSLNHLKKSSFWTTLVASFFCFNLCNATELIVNAKGSEAGGAFAHFRVIVDGVRVGQSYTTATYQPYVYNFTSPASPVQEVKVVFDNDKRIDGKDRNLYIQSIELDGVLYPAPGEHVVYIRKDGEIVEYKKVMPWSGALIFTVDPEPVICSGNDTLSTQAEVDAFHCEEFTGTLTISGNDITNLDGLASLKKVGNLRIADNPLLINITGLSSLMETEYGISIVNNTSLTSLNGLEQIKRSDLLVIQNNPALTNVDGLSSVEWGADVFIINNDALTNLDGLSSLVNVSYGSAGSGDVRIEDNDALTNIDGLANLKNISEQLYIEDNHALRNLPEFNELYFSNYISIRRNTSLNLIRGFSQDIEVIYGFIIVENDSLTNCCTLYPLTVAPYIYTLEINNNGDGCSLEDISANGPCEGLIVNAKGSRAFAFFAHFTVLVNGQKKGGAYTSSNYESYGFPFTADETIEEVQVVFDNDSRSGDSDRNLYVESIVVDGVLYPAPAENVTYIRKDGAVIDYRRVMPWNGALIFDLTANENSRFAGNYETRDSTRVSLTATVYPNPSDGQFTLDLSNFQEGMVDIALYDLAGKMLVSKQATISKEDSYRTMDFYYPQKGIYLLKIANNENTIDRKLVVN